MNEPTVAAVDAFWIGFHTAQLAVAFGGLRRGGRPAATRDALTRVVEAARRVPRLEGPSPGAVSSGSVSSGSASLGHARMPALMAAWKRLLDALPPLVQQAAAGFAPLALS